MTAPAIAAAALTALHAPAATATNHAVVYAAPPIGAEMGEFPRGLWPVRRGASPRYAPPPRRPHPPEVEG